MSTPAKEAKESAFTPREQQIMAYAWLCFEGEPKVDYAKLAGYCGMSNPRSASNAWSGIKQKLATQAAEAGGEGGASPTKKATPKATPKRKKKADADADDEEASPTKKAKTPKSGGKGKAKKSEEKVVEEDADAETGAGAEGGETIKVEEKDELS